MGKKNLIDKVMKKTAESTRNPFTKLLIGITAFATAYSLISPAVALEGTDAEEVLGDEQTEETVTKEPEVTEIPTEITTEEAPAQQEQTADEQPAVTETQDEEQPAVTDTQEEEPAQAPADETQPAEGEQAEEEPAEEAVAQSRTVYEYVEEGVLKVTATLEYPDAVPDEAELVVTPVTAGLEEYNYDAYLEALNKSTEEKEYTPENTLLYDVAFMLDGVEIQPSKGTVAVYFEFLKNQLTSDLGASAETEANVEIKHLPLTDEVKETVDTTSDAVEITASDIVVENVTKEKVDLTDETQTLEFKTENFSVFAVNYTVDFTYDGYEFSIAGTSSILLSDLFAALGINADAAQAKSVVFTDTTLVSVEQQEDGNWLLTSLNAFNTEETLTVTMSDGTKYVINVTDAQDDGTYTVELLFDPAGSGFGNNYSVYASVLYPNRDGKNVTYYSSQSVNLNGATSTTVQFSKFTRTNDVPNEINYSSDMDVTALVVHDLVIEQNGDERGTIQKGDVIEDGDVIGTYVVSVNSSGNKTTYTFKQPEPYKYSITESQNNAISFDAPYQNNWYMLSTLTKASGETYYYVTPVSLNGSSAIPASGQNSIPMYYFADTSNIDKVQIGNESANNYNQGKTRTSIYQTGDSVENELIHVSKQATNYNEIVNGTDNNRESFGNGSVANKYAVSSISENGVGNIVLIAASGG